MVILGLASFLGAVGLVLWNRRKNRRLLENLNQMLDRAMEGSFAEDAFDESLLSSVETKLARYLAASAVSARNLREEKDKIKTLIGDISHQTKTPIANLLLYTQLLQEQPLPEAGRVCVDALAGQTEKLQALIEALVKTSRLESGMIALRPERGGLGPVIRSAAAQLIPKAQQKEIEILLGDVEGSAVFDAKWTEEALVNLLDNAVKYTPAGGKVSIRVKEYPMFTSIEVEDSGPGISEEEQPRVFQRFYRGLAHGEAEGVGIGLYLVRSIAQGQNGYVKVSSKPGTGSTFSLWLPRA